LALNHENDAVGIGGDGLEVVVAGGYGGVDIEAEIAGTHVLIERLDEAEVGGTVFVGDAFNIERESSIDGIRGEQAHDLLAKRGAFGGILEHVANTGVPVLGVGIEIVEGGEDFGVGASQLNDLFYFVQVVGIVDCVALNNRILTQVVAAHHHQRALRRVHMQPLRKEQVDLLDVILERGVAARVVLHVISGAQSFTGIQGNLRRLALGFAARGALVLGVAESRGVRQCLVIVAGDR
jgi:hypothetical protein